MSLTYSNTFYFSLNVKFVTSHVKRDQSVCMWCVFLEGKEMFREFFLSPPPPQAKGSGWA